MKEIVSAVFTDPEEARRAYDWLSRHGVPDSALSVVGRDHSTSYTSMEDDMDDEEGDHVAVHAGAEALAGVGIGAGVGALLGLAATAIPGVGPFIGAGALVHALGAAGGAAASGAIVGGTSGGLASVFSHWGLSEADSNYYSGEVERGGTYMGVDLAQTTVPRETIMDAFRRYNARFSM